MAVKTGGGGPRAHVQQQQHDQVKQQQVPQKDVKAKTQQQQKGKKGDKMSAADAARVASQAGFQRLGANKKKKGFDLGDGSSQQFALPEDDADAENWSPDKLKDAQGTMTLASAQFGEFARGADEGASMGAAIVGSSFMPNEEDLEEMDYLARKKPPEPMPMLEEMSGNLSNLFGIDLDEVPVGHQLLAAGLAVAGETESIEVDKGALREDKLATGIEKVTKRGNQSVGEAQRMNKGISDQLNVQRTMVFKR